MEKTFDEMSMLQKVHNLNERVKQLEKPEEVEDGED